MSDVLKAPLRGLGVNWADLLVQTTPSLFTIPFGEDRATPNPLKGAQGAEK